MGELELPDLLGCCDAGGSCVLATRMVFSDLLIADDVKTTHVHRCVESFESLADMRAMQIEDQLGACDG
jgi:hypothetical protein